MKFIWRRLISANWFVLYDVHPLSIYNSGIYCALTQFVIMPLPPMIIDSTVKLKILFMSFRVH